jgi:hypothetical protein
MLEAHGIQTEEGLHRPWRAASFESSVMVSLKDHPTASVLYKELEIPPGRPIDSESKRTSKQLKRDELEGFKLLVFSEYVKPPENKKV